MTLEHWYPLYWNVQKQIHFWLDIHNNDKITEGSDYWSTDDFYGEGTIEGFNKYLDKLNK